MAIRVRAFVAEMSALSLRDLIQRAEQRGVDKQAINTATDAATIIKLIVAKVQQQGGSLEPGAKLTLQPCSPAYGHALGKLLGACLAKMVLVSTPEFGPGPGDGEFKVPVMSGLERLANYLFPTLIPTYDFAGSASAADCREQIPDCDLHKFFDLPEACEPWRERPDIIEKTHWMRYWMGGVRSALRAMLLSAQPLPGTVSVKDCIGGGVGFNQHSLHVFATSISGGTITQTEKAALAGLIRGVTADLSTRAMGLGNVFIHWLHFDSLEDYLKALQGYGGIDLRSVLSRSNFGLPGQWIDGPYNEEYDMLKHVPGATLEERRAHLLTAAEPDQAKLDEQLSKAIMCKSTERVRELLGLDGENKPLPEAQRPSLLPHPEQITVSYWHAAQELNFDAMEALLAAGANLKALDDDWATALSLAAQFGGSARKAVPGVAKEVDRVIELCAQKQLGMSYAEHAASLTLGAAVTWTAKQLNITVPECTGTIIGIVEINGEGPVRRVQGASGKIQNFRAAMLRLASEEEGARIAAQREQMLALHEAEKAEALPLVKEIFAMFDADGDGKLSEEEMKAFFHASGDLEQLDTSEMPWEMAWPKLCEQLGCTTDGVTQQGLAQMYDSKELAAKALDMFKNSAPSATTWEASETGAMIASLPSKPELLVDGEPLEFALGDRPEGAPELRFRGAVVATQPSLVDAELTNAATLAGAVALAHRGGVPFDEKVERTAAAGAVALIVVNTDDELLEPAGVAVFPIPVLMVRSSAGEKLASAEELALTLAAATIASTRQDQVAQLQAYLTRHNPSVTAAQVEGLVDQERGAALSIPREAWLRLSDGLNQQYGEPLVTTAMEEQMALGQQMMQQETAIRAFVAEMSALSLRDLIQRAEQRGVDKQAINTATDAATIIKLIVAKVQQQGGSLEPGAKLTLQPCSPAYGHALGKLLGACLAKMVLVSTPEFGPGPGDGEFKVPVMSGLERLANYLFPTLIPTYDFAGSASAADCREQIPDCDLHKFFDLPEACEPWRERPDIIEKTHWMRYWMGGVRSALRAMLLSAQPLPGTVSVKDCIGGGVGFNQHSLHVFATSISGGTITQTEKAALAGLIRGVTADLSTRAMGLGNVFIHWLHFDSLEDYLKALQGYGGIDLRSVLSRSNFGLPGQWIDGPYNEEYDMLKHVPGATLEERRAHLLTAAEPDQAKLDEQLSKAIMCKSTERVRELLGLDGENKPLPEAQRPRLLANVDGHIVSDTTPFIMAAQELNCGAMEALLAAGADPQALRTDGLCALSRAVEKGSEVPKDVVAVAEEVDRVIELCAQKQLGMSYAEHVARLTVGAAVSWTVTIHPSFPEERVGTIIAIRESDGGRGVEGASGNRAMFSPAVLRLASEEEGARIAAQREQMLALHEAEKAEALLLVKEIFAMFDADGDGKLSEEEMKAFFHASGQWEAMQAASGTAWGVLWPIICERNGCTTDGMTLQGLAGMYDSKELAAKALEACVERLS
eukprot:COSAG04_NODE_834_length_9992_cov_54.919786_5_plen_1490_part_00